MRYRNALMAAAAMALLLSAIPKVIGFAVILIIGWAIGFFGYAAGGIIHVLLVIAIILILLKVIRREA